MKTAAASLFDMFDLKQLPTKAQYVITSLLYTLHKNHLLTDGIEDISQLIKLDKIQDNQKYIASLVQIPEMVGLQDNRRALELAVALYPYSVTLDEYSVITVPTEDYSKIFTATTKKQNNNFRRRAVKAINALNLGYKIFQLHRENPYNMFHLVKYSDRQDLIKNLQKHNIMMPSILDRVLA